VVVWLKAEYKAFGFLVTGERFEAFGVVEIRKSCVVIFCPKEQATSFFVKLTNDVQDKQIWCRMAKLNRLSVLFCRKRLLSARLLQIQDGINEYREIFK
jgi:hypothetical protein